MMNTANNNALSLKNDYLFKAVYGSDNEDSKCILLSLLNKILGRDENPITSIEYKNPFQGKAYLEDKETILDIKAITNNNEMIDIEMQITWDPRMPARLLYYHAGLIRESLKEGQPYKELPPTITICITNTIAFTDTDCYMSKFYFQEETSHFKLTEDSMICCIELPKVNSDKRPIEELNPLEVCLEYLKYAGEHNSAYVAELIQQGGKELKMAQEKINRFTSDDILRERAIAREKYQRDMLSWKENLKEADQKRAEAAQMCAEADQIRAEADQIRAEADQIRIEADQKVRKAIVKLKSCGFNNEKIAETLDLSIEEVLQSI